MSGVDAGGYSCGMAVRLISVAMARGAELRIRFHTDGLWTAGLVGGRQVGSGTTLSLVLIDLANRLQQEEEEPRHE